MKIVKCNVLLSSYIHSYGAEDVCFLESEEAQQIW